MPDKVEEFFAGDFYQGLAKRAASANVIVENTQGELLVVKAHYKPYWSLPGGWIEDSDTPRQSAKRELAEEVGLEVDESSLELASVIDRISPHADTYLFVFRLIDQIDKSTKFKLQSDEIADFAWVTKAEIHEELHGRYNAAVKNWASDQPKTYIEYEL